jgi:hypothetical protein
LYSYSSRSPPRSHCISEWKSAFTLLSLIAPAGEDSLLKRQNGTLMAREVTYHSIAHFVKKVEKAGLKTEGFPGI